MAGTSGPGQPCPGHHLMAVYCCTCNMQSCKHKNQQWQRTVSHGLILHCCISGSIPTHRTSSKKRVPAYVTSAAVVAGCRHQQPWQAQGPQADREEAAGVLAGLRTVDEPHTCMLAAAPPPSLIFKMPAHTPNSSISTPPCQTLCVRPETHCLACMD